MWLSGYSYHLCVCVCTLQNLLLSHWNLILDKQIHYYFYPKMAQNPISDQLNFKIFLEGMPPDPQHELPPTTTAVLKI